MTTVNFRVLDFDAPDLDLTVTCTEHVPTFNAFTAVPDFLQIREDEALTEIITFDFLSTFRPATFRSEACEVGFPTLIFG